MLTDTAQGCLPGLFDARHLPFIMSRDEKSAPAKPPNRLREFRLRQRPKMTQGRLGELAGIDQRQISAFESGARPLNERARRKLAPVLGCGPDELLNGPPTVPLTVTVCAAASECRHPLDRPEPHERHQAPRYLQDPQDCFTALVGDESCDMYGWPCCTELIARRVAPGDTLQRGDMVIVRRYRVDRADGRTYEILAGRLDRAVDGALMVQLRSTRAALRGAVVIQAADADDTGMPPAAAPPHAVTGDEIAWQPRPDDPADIIGVVAWAIAPLRKLADGGRDSNPGNQQAEIAVT